MSNNINKFTDLPKRVIKEILKVEKKIVTYPLDEKFKRIKEKYQDIKENRELIVVDKFGNRYYQYYSNQGLPTRRVVINNQKGFNKWDDDPFMLSWLQMRRMVPPTQEELEKMYIENEEFQRRGLEWDKKEKALIDEWKKLQKGAIDAERKETKSIGDGVNFSPGVWDRQPSKALVEVKTEEKALIEGASSLPGKYLMDFKYDDENYIKKKTEELNRPYMELAKKVDWQEYTLEKMLIRTQKGQFEEKNKLIIKKKELTNLGKRLLEKKKVYQTYSNFRERYNDVFEENEFI